MNRAALVALAVLVLVVTPAVRAGGDAPAQADASIRAEDVPGRIDGRAVAALFKARCASCHGTDGRARTALGQKLRAADLTSTDLDHDEISRVVREGRGQMKAQGDKLSPEQARDLARYVNELREALGSVDDRGLLE
jgi:mono/diheme cytochrome c family protein